MNVELRPPECMALMLDIAAEHRNKARDVMEPGTSCYSNLKAAVLTCIGTCGGSSTGTPSCRRPMTALPASFKLLTVYRLEVGLPHTWVRREEMNLLLSIMAPDVVCFSATDLSASGMEVLVPGLLTTISSAGLDRGACRRSRCGGAMGVARVVVGLDGVGLLEDPTVCPLWWCWVCDGRGSNVLTLPRSDCIVS